MRMTTDARSPRLDLLTWPVIGPFLKWRHARTAMQIPIFLLAGLMIFDGLVGPQLAPKNLATVGAWLHYRGLVVLTLLVAGNLFCMACPFMLPRQAGVWLRKRLGGEGRPPPKILRNKWLAIGLVVAFFFCYEYFSLWATPWWTAWVALAYFGIAFAVDTIFRGAAFCKYVCPLGQFNFFGSLISPLEMSTRMRTSASAKHPLIFRADARAAGYATAHEIRGAARPAIAWKNQANLRHLRSIIQGSP